MKRVTVAGTISAARQGEAVPSTMPGDALVLANPRGALLQRTTGDDGAPLLTLYVADKEVSWDDPRHFAFAEALASGAEFQPEQDTDAMDLAEAAAMLDALREAGLLVRAADAAQQDRHDNKVMPSPLPPAPMARARTWVDGPSLMAELTGVALDTGYLEAVVPVFRTAHLFLDRDGRHIGEANAFPAAARTDVPTEWRGCPYPGNRYQPDKPMNMTALKAMRAHWRQMMGLLLPIRSAYLARFPDAAAGWTVAHVERLAVCVLALPSFVMLRRDAPVANGGLHPALSNLFRVTDGLRMVMHHMLFVPLYEPMHRPDAPVTVADILAYADRNFLFHSDHGVCAGPRFMIEDFLGVLLNGQAPRSGFDAEPDAELVAAAALIEPAVDYGLLGLHTFGTVFSLWPAMARCYARLNDLLDGQTGAAAAMAARFAGHFDALSHRSFLASEEWRAHREAVYDDMFAACARGLGEDIGGPALSEQLAAGGAPGATAARAVLVEAAAAHFGPGNAALADDFAAIVTDFLERARHIVALAETIQRRTGALLSRPLPGHRLTLHHLNLHNVLMGEDQRSVPFLPDELAHLLGVAIHLDAQNIEVSPIEIRRGRSSASTHSPAQSAADTRAFAR